MWRPTLATGKPEYQAFLGVDITPAVQSAFYLHGGILLISIVLGGLLHHRRQQRQADLAGVRAAKAAVMGSLSPQRLESAPLPPVVDTAQSANASPSPAYPPRQKRVSELTLNEVWEQQISFSAAAQNISFSQRSKMLDRTLASYEEGWIERLLCCPCLLVIGRPGSAKSSFAAALAICREVLLKKLTGTIVIDPNAHLKAKSKTWQPHWELKGSSDNWAEIDEAIGDMYQRFANSTGANYISSIYDELTAYKGNVHEDKLGGFLPQITSKARAANEYITLVSHSDTLACLGGGTGQARLKDDMVQLGLGSLSVKGGRGKLQPSGRGTMSGLDFDHKGNPLDVLVTLPRWFDPAILIGLFPELYEATSEGGSDETTATTAATSALLPAEVAEVAELTGGSGGSDDVSRLLLLEVISREVAVVAPEVALPVLDAVLTAITSGASDTKIVEQVLKMKGRAFSKGKYILKVIRQTIENTKS